MAEVAKVRDVVVRDTGSRNPTKTPAETFVYVDVAAVDNTAKAITGARQVLGSDAPSRARKLIRQGDVLVSTVRPNLNAVAMVPPELDGQVASTGFCVLRASERVLPEFLYYFTRARAFVESLTSLVAGAMYPAVTDSQVLDQELPLPPVCEQRSIVDLFVRAEGIVRLRREAERNAAELIPALFLDMFGDPATNPKGWVVVPTGGLVRLVNGRAFKPAEWGKEGMPIIRIQNLNDSSKPFNYYEGDLPEKYRVRSGDILLSWSPDQAALRKRIAELTPRFKVANPTRFKFLLAKASPSVTLMDRLWRIYEHAPHYYPQVAGLLSKFDEIPERHAKRLIHEIEGQQLYPAVRAAFINASIGRMPSGTLPKAKTALKPLWQPKHGQADLSDALWRWLCHERHFTMAQMRYGFRSQVSWWLQMRIHFGMDWDAVSTGQQTDWLNQTMRSKHADVAISAAWLCGYFGIPPARPTKDIHPLAKLMLKEHGLMRRANSSVCGIRLAISEMTDQDVPIQWRKFFGKAYKRAEAQITTCKGYFKTDPSAWVNAIDVFVDLLLDSLHRHQPALGGYTLGRAGSTLDNPVRLRAAYPAVTAMAIQFHHKRLESNLSHAIVRKTKKPTKSVKFKWLRAGARALLKGIQELDAKGV